MQFHIIATDKDTSARSGKLITPHGTVETPVFMPVGTAGTVKAIHLRDLKTEIGARIILGNTYHLYLRPGLEVLQNAGGLHCFTGWSKPILTDSGGFQVYSLSDRRKITEEGVQFQSHIDGSRHMFTPEAVMDIQRVIGADIIMAFDECTSYPSTYQQAKQSMHLTHRWLHRCINHLSKTQPLYGFEQSLFPIVQGGLFPELRRESANEIAATMADGYAIGGLSVGEPVTEMYETTALVCEILPAAKPRYLMGVGTPANILESIALGIDMFDCVMPTRNGRNGMLFTQNGIINIRNKKWKFDNSKIDPDGTAFVDLDYSKAYLRHLFVSGEMLGPMIASLHNLAFYLWLVNQARSHIEAGNFLSWKSGIIKQLSHRL
ncbi:MAG TPA: tRNA guanosine(34) transglycosylase Tgt [Bacteroidales bacterium]|nr:tRNA guanosine(34) transglycosylase Tgt [Bacteroidales bacterium]